VLSGRVHFTARLHQFGDVFVQRWILEAATREFIVGRGAAYRWFGDG
jgi:hypothetical protein